MSTNFTNIGFRTGSNKEIIIDEEALKNAMKLFEGIDDEPVQLMGKK